MLSPLAFVVSYSVTFALCYWAIQTTENFGGEPLSRRGVVGAAGTLAFALSLSVASFWDSSAVDRFFGGAISVESGVVVLVVAGWGVILLSLTFIIYFNNVYPTCHFWAELKSIARDRELELSG